MPGGKKVGEPMTAEDIADTIAAFAKAARAAAEPLPGAGWSLARAVRKSSTGRLPRREG